MPKENVALERAIAGALRSAITDHGPITPEHIGSAVKRIVGNLANAQAGALGRALAAKRWSKTSPEERSEVGAALAKGRWASMTAPERSEEMKRRRRIGLEKKAKKT